MSNYGQLIDSGYDPNKERIYTEFANYFRNPLVTKIKDVEGFSVYMAKIYSMLGNAYRYLVVFIQHSDVGKKEEKGDIGSTKYLEECEWVSLQTRTLEDVHDIPTHKYTITKRTPLMQKIRSVKIEDKSTVYDCDDYDNLTVTLLHTKDNCKYQYQSTGTIVSAIETYQTLINFKKSAFDV